MGRTSPSARLVPMMRAMPVIRLSATARENPQVHSPMRSPWQC